MWRIYTRNFFHIVSTQTKRFDHDKAQQAIAKQMSIGVNIDLVEMGL